MRYFLLMPMDGLMIRATVFELNNLLQGARVDKVNQPENDELHILTRNNGQNYKLLLCSNANFARLNITEISKSNPITPSSFCMLLRKHLTGAKINRFEQIDNERIVNVYFDCLNDFNEPVVKKLIIEIMGKHSNIIFVDENNRIYDSIKRVNSLMSRVRLVQPGIQYVLPPSQDKTNPFKQAHFEELSARIIADKYMGISRQSAEEIAFRNSFDINAFKNYLNLFVNHDYTPVVLKNDKGEPVDFFAVFQQRFLPQNQVVCSSISQAIDDYYLLKDRVQRINERAHGLKIKLSNLLEKALKKKAQQEEKKTECSDIEKYRIFGELITANIYLIKKGASEVEVLNYYDNNLPILIPLDKTVSASINAQKYFKQYNKQKRAKEILLPRQAEDETELSYVESILSAVAISETDEDLKEIETELTEMGVLRAQKATIKKNKKETAVPFREFEHNGMKILVGRNNLQNERLLKLASPDDIWLHTQKYHSSHVIILVDGGQVCDETILYGAKLCAYYSQAQGGDKIPVDYCKRKFVKKPKGGKAGFVTYTDYKTVLVDARIEGN